LQCSTFALALTLADEVFGFFKILILHG
jgi:hypothetical protein